MSTQERPTLAQRVSGFRPSVITRGAPIYPLVVLFGLNAFDEFDREAFTIMLPNIQRFFGIDTLALTSLYAAVGVAVLLIEVPLAHFADRSKRTNLVAGGALVFSLFTGMTGMIPFGFFWLMYIARGGSVLGRAVERPVHRALLSDYYPVEARPSVFAFHSAANTMGQFAAPLLAGTIAYYFGWRYPFLLFAIPTVIFGLLALRLKEPVRGVQERRAMGASEEIAATEEEPASFAEAWRILWQIKSARRFWISLPILAIPTVAVRPLLQLFYADELGLNEIQRGVIAAIAEPFQFVGLFVGIPIAIRIMRRDPGNLIRFVSIAAAGTILGQLVLVATRNVVAAVAISTVTQTMFAVLAPGLATMQSLILPPRVRSLGFTIGGLFSLPAFFFIPIVGGFADQWSLRTALLVFLPIQFIGPALLWTIAKFVPGDIHKIRTSTLAMSEVRLARSRGESKMLLVKDLDVAYDTVKVLFGVNLEVDEGEIVALLGTNGAGKSTLLKAISGIVEADAGAVIFDGADMTYAPPNDIAMRGVIQVPGGRGVFPMLTVSENLKLAGWLYRSDPDYLREATERVLDYFPVLRVRWDQPAGNLSGGEQQMLTLGMAFIAKPKLLMIDELSLGLAPVIVEQLLGIVRAIRDQGTTIILVEQSANIALTIAETAYFMEKGEIRFHGPTSELLNRPDILRSVFLEGAASVTGGNGASKTGKGSPARTTARRPEIARESATPLLEIQDMSKTFGGVRAVDHVSLALYPGEILGVIGPNGAGKTTLFDLISGFITPDTGRTTLSGRDITELSPEARARIGLGRSFQDARLFPALTVSEAIALSLARQVRVKDPLAAFLNLPAVQLSEREVERRTEELIDLMGISTFRDKFVSELSTGSRRIVDLACVLAHDPEVLLFDEPSSGIAQRETEALGPLLLRIREATGASVLVIEHDMPLVTSIADEIVAMDLGAVIARGVPQEIVHHPRVVASYLGTSEDIIARSGDIIPAALVAKRTRKAARARSTTKSG